VRKKEEIIKTKNEHGKVYNTHTHMEKARLLLEVVELPPPLPTSILLPKSASIYPHA